MVDYAKLIDAETRAFIERTQSFYPPDADRLTLAGQRAVYDRMCRAFHAGHPVGVTSRTTAIKAAGHDIPVRVYRRDEPDDAAMVIYFHGGGFVFGGLESHDDVCAELCGRTGYAVLSVAYRLAPEHLHPADFDDAMTAFEWATGTYDRKILLVGDSAGGNLAAAVSHATRGHARNPAGQVLIYPSLGGDHAQGSYVAHADAPMLTARDLEFYKRMRTGDRDATGLVTLAPLADGNFANLPPTVIVTAECDPLSSDGQAYRDRIVADGGRAFWHEEKGLVHGYLRARHTVGRARSSFTRIVDAVSTLGKGKWVW